MVTRERVANESAEPDEASVRTLLRRLGTDTESLLRAELTLAKLEFRELARQAALNGVKVGIAAAIGFAGMLAILAWLVLVLGEALGGAHGTAALIVGVLLLATGALLGFAGLRGLKRESTPRATIDSLQTGRDWAQQEVQQLRSGLKERAPRSPELPPA